MGYCDNPKSLKMVNKVTEFTPPVIRFDEEYLVDDDRYGSKPFQD